MYYRNAHSLFYTTLFVCAVTILLSGNYMLLAEMYNDCVVICHIAAQTRILRVFCMLLSTHVTVHSHGVKVLNCMKSL